MYIIDLTSPNRADDNMATNKSSSSSSSYITVDEYEFPRGANGVGTLVCAALMVLSARRKFIEPRSVIHDHLLARSVKAAKYSKLVQDIIFYVLFGLHVPGTVWFAWTQLKRHNVSPFSVLGLKWLVTVFFGGRYALNQWDETVQKKETQVLKEI
ncbi:hypothetical protein ABEF93_003953 [Exophiala dermatitidis]